MKISWYTLSFPAKSAKDPDEIGDRHPTGIGFAESLENIQQHSRVSLLVFSLFIPSFRFNGLNGECNLDESPA